MEECFAAHRVLELDELLEDLIILKVPQRLIFHVAINVGGGHVGVVSTFKEYLQLNILVLVHKVDEVPRFQEVADTGGGPSKVTEV